MIALVDPLIYMYILYDTSSIWIMTYKWYTTCFTCIAFNCGTRISGIMMNDNCQKAQLKISLGSPILYDTAKWQ